MKIRLLGPGDAAVLDDVDPDVFDHAIDPRLRDEFLADPRHHLDVAIDEGTVVGMVSGVHYVHPDKPPELWINEVGVAASHRRMGVAQRLLAAMFDHARALGCGEAWVLTESDNAAAMRLYASAGGTPLRPNTVMFSFRLDDEGEE